MSDTEPCHQCQPSNQAPYVSGPDSKCTRGPLGAQLMDDPGGGYILYLPTMTVSSRAPTPKEESQQTAMVPMPSL